jgi:transposase
LRRIEIWLEDLAMSLKDFDTQGTLFGSVASVGGALFRDEDRFKLFAQKIWPLLAASRPVLAECYDTSNGRPALEPVVMLGVLIFQFLERTPDRQTAELAKYHLGWKLALNLELWAGSFHPTSLVEFRQRLLKHDKARLAFEVVLEGLMQEGFVPRKGKQRLDSTHVLGLVSAMSKLESIRETLRLALQELEEHAAEGAPDFWAVIWERYVEHKIDYRSTDRLLKEKHLQAGSDACKLLGWIETLPAETQKGRQARLLREVFGQYYVVSEDQTAPVEKHGPGAVQNPHDGEAKWCAKGKAKAKKEWVGYKVQVAESVGAKSRENGEPTRNFLTSVVTQAATESDDAGMKETLKAQAAMGLEKPTELFVDAGYISAEAIVEAQAEGRELVGPARPSPRNAKGSRSEDFAVCVEERRAICPAGHQSTQCSRLEEQTTGKVSYRFEWSTHCHACPLREKCIGKRQSHRTLVVGEHHTVLQERRKEQKTEAFAQRMRERNAIEGTQSELVRAHGQRQARYRGKGKVDLQNQLIGAACNIKRWLKLLAWDLRATVVSAVKAVAASTIAVEA